MFYLNVNIKLCRFDIINLMSITENKFYLINWLCNNEFNLRLLFKMIEKIILTTIIEFSCLSLSNIHI